MNLGLVQLAFKMYAFSAWINSVSQFSFTLVQISDTLSISLFIKCHDTVQVQSWTTEIYSSFASIYINPGIYSYLITVGLGSVKKWKGLYWVAWVLISIARVEV